MPNPNHITLDRIHASDGSCTLGKLTLPSGWSCFTLENPWLDNARNISCIPQGWYELKKRPSPLITRISKGKHLEGWEVTCVVGRSYIMFHAGNYVKDTDGCVLVGSSVGRTESGELMLMNSGMVFDDLMSQLESKDRWVIEVFDSAVEELVLYA